MPRKRREAGIEFYPPGELRNSPYWYVRGTYLGVAVLRSTRSRRKPPRQFIRDIEREIEKRVESGDAGPAQPTFADAALEYLKVCPQAEVKYVHRLLKQFGQTLLSNIGTAEIHAAAMELHPHQNPSTWNRNVVTPMSAVLHLAADLDLCEWKRIKRFRTSIPARRIATPDEAATLIAAFPQKRWLHPPRQRGANQGRWVYPRACCVFLFATGCRIGEAVRLDFSAGDVVFEHRAAILRATKNQETYEVALHDMAYGEIEALPHRTGRVFGYRYPRQFLDDWRAAGDSCGIETRKSEGGLTPHGARHSFATWLRRQGKGLREIKDLGRWKDDKSVMRYLHFAAEEQREAMENLPLIRKKRGNSQGDA